MHATSRTQLENRSLQHVERSIQERATLLATSYASLRMHNLTRAELEVLAGYTEVFRVAQGMMIFHDRLLATLGPGHLLGEMAFLDGQTRSATAVAEKDTTLLVGHPSLVARLLPGLLRMLILRLRRTNLKLVDRLSE